MKKLTKSITLSLSALLAVGVLSTQVVADDKNGGELTVATHTDLVSLDPHASTDVPSNQTRSVIYEGLVEFDENLEIQPLLADSWENPDDTTWHFQLVEGVTFHDGSELTAEVVKANLKRLTDPLLASPRASLFEVLEEVNVIDDYTIEIVTEYPFSPLLEHLAHDASGLMSKEIIDEDYQNALDQAGIELSLEEYYELRDAGDDEALEEEAGEIGQYLSAIIERNPVGTGYMKYESRTPGDSTTLARFDDYWREPAYLDTVTFKVVSETGSRLAELETGNSEIILSVEASNIERVEQMENAELYKQTGIGFEYIGFNLQKEPFDDVRVRQALAHALDKELILEGVFDDSGTVARGPMAPQVLGHDKDFMGLEYDVEKARELLAEAGYEDGFSFTLTTGDYQEAVMIALVFQEAMAELNVDVELQQVEFGALLEMTGQGEHDALLLGWSNSSGSSDGSIGPLFHSDMFGPPGNRFFYENPEVDQLIEEGRSEIDDDAREQIYKDAAKIIVEDAPAIFVRHFESLNAYSTAISGYDQTRMNTINFRGIYFND